VIFGQGYSLGVIIKGEVLPSIRVLPREIEIQRKLQVSHFKYYKSEGIRLIKVFCTRPLTITSLFIPFISGNQGI
jgi:hypothetical protein